MRKRQKMLYRAAAIAFLCICLPIWIFRGCLYANRLVGEEHSRVELFVNKDGHLTKMDIEEYLVGVVSAEMPASYPLEALKAQAVAARTYTARKLRTYGGDGCANGGDICTDSSHCQAYCDESGRNKKWGKAFAQYEKKIRQAVTQTDGELVLYDDKPIEAFFHSTAGGMTENSENAFMQALPYLVSVASNETDAPHYQSTVKISRKKFVDIVNAYCKQANLKAANLEKTVSVKSRFESGRAQTITIGSDEITGKELRNLFSLDSTNVSFSFDDKNVSIKTKGYGHGVGMSQAGAGDMAESGASYDEILIYYYTGVSVKKCW